MGISWIWHLKACQYAICLLWKLAWEWLLTFELLHHCGLTSPICHCHDRTNTLILGSSIVPRFIIFGDTPHPTPLNRIVSNLDELVHPLTSSAGLTFLDHCKRLPLASAIPLCTCSIPIVELTIAWRGISIYLLQFHHFLIHKFGWTGTPQQFIAWIQRTSLLKHPYLTDL